MGSLRPVTALPARDGCRLRRLIVDDAPLRTTSRETLAAIGFCSGDETDPDALVRRIEQAEPAVALTRALRILGYRERSHGEIRQRLTEDGYPDSVVCATIQRLEDLELVDDRRFASSFVRTKRAAAWGRSRVERGLRRADIDDDTARAALDEAYPPGEDEAIARRIVTSGPPASLAEAKRLATRLQRRGIPLGLAVAVATEALRTASDDGADGRTP